MTARSKAQKREAKRGRGRPRLPASSREPNGQPSRRAASVEKSSMHVVKAQRMKRFGITDKQATDTEWEDVLSLLYRHGAITDAQRKAGDNYRRMMGKFYHLDNIPHPSAKAQDYLRGSPGHDGEDSSEEQSQAAKANTQARLARNALLRCGDIATARKVLAAVDMATILNRDDMFLRRYEATDGKVEWRHLPALSLLCMGLNRLVKAL